MSNDETEKPTTNGTEEVSPPKPRKPHEKPELWARRGENKLVPGHNKTILELKQSARKRISRLEKIKQSKQRETAKIADKASAAKQHLKKLDEKFFGKPKNKLIEAEDIRKATPTIREFLEEQEVIFRPNPGPQTDFLAASEDEVLYGGARGGGKSYSMLVDPLRHCDNRAHRFLLIRRTMPELRDLIYLSKQLYPKAFPGAKFHEQEKEWRFPSGARGEFGYAESLDDAMRYQGQPYTWIGIDELGQFPTDDIWTLLRGSLRDPTGTIPTGMRATANPGGPGQAWIKRMFIDPAPFGQAFKVKVDTPLGERYLTRRFIPAKLKDNPYLLRTEAYMIMLSSLPEAKRRQWLEGDWDVTEGAAFPEWNRQYHVCDPFPIPRNWPRFRSCDWGYTQPACVLWFAVDYNNDLYVYRELYVKGITADRFAKMVTALEQNDPKPMRGIMDSSVWAKRGDPGPTIPEVMGRLGCQWRPSDRSPGSRKAGKMEIHRRLALVSDQTRDVGPDGKYIIKYRPRMKIFNNCKNLIATLPILPLDDTDLEDVNTDAEDHAYDALRYGVMSRPIGPGGNRELWGIRASDNRNIAHPTFGY